MIVVVWDLATLGILAYKELILSATFFVLPQPRKPLSNEIVAVSSEKLLCCEHFPEISVLDYWLKSRTRARTRSQNCSTPLNCGLH
jgi:hypothetical protein